MFRRNLSACIIYSLMLVLIIATVSGCENEDGKSSQQNEEITLHPSEGRPGSNVEIHGYSFGSLLQGNIVKFGDEHADVTSVKYDSEGEDILKVIVPANATTGSVTIQVGNNILEGPVFTVIRHAITSVSPAEGFPGQKVIIKGAFFDNELTNNKVLLNGTPLVISSASETQLEVTIPQGAMTGNIVVEISGVREIGPQFTIKNVTEITSVFPAGGQVGTKLQISGKNFNLETDKNIVTINGVAANVLEVTGTGTSTMTLTVMIPEGASTGKLSVTANEQEAIWQHNIDIPEESPWINLFSLIPFELLPGMRFKVDGGRFSPEPAFNNVKIGDIPLTVLNCNSYSLILEVPKDIDFKGKIYIREKISVTVNNRTYTPASEGGNLFIYREPIVLLKTGYESGKAGDEITLVALVLPMYDPEAIKVSFKGMSGARIEAQITAVEVTNMKVIVPPDAATGRISVQVYDGMPGYTGIFTIETSDDN